MNDEEFIINAKLEFSNLFREAFLKMNATFSEKISDKNTSIVRFKVKCERSKIEILNREIPPSAYAKIGFAEPPRYDF